MKRITQYSGMAVALFASNFALSGELDLNAGVSTEYVIQSVEDIENDNDIDSDNLIVRPFLSATYQSKDLSALVRATHNHVRRSLDDADASNNYTDFNYLGRYDVIENLLNLQVNGTQNYRSQSANSFLVDDFLLNAENLRKNKTNAASLTLSMPTGRYVGISARAGISSIDSKSEAREISPDSRQIDISSTNLDATVFIESGRDLRPFLYDVSGTFRKSDRENNQDFESQTVNLTVGSNVSADVSLRLLGYYENNDISRDDSITGESTNALREFYSYGIGVAWQPSNNRFIELGWNRSTTKGRLGEDDDEDDYLSVDLRWNLSSRTSLSGSYARRFFGSSGSFRFNHNLRNWRSGITYTENVTTNSQLLFNQEQGLFVCANGSTDLSDCSLSDGISEEDLGPDDILVPGLINDFELNDRVVIRKALTAQTALDLRRTRLSASISKSNSEEVESFRDIDTITGRLQANFQISERTSINANLTYSDVERDTDDELTGSVIKEAGIRLERRFTRRFFASAGYRYLDRNGDTIGNAGGIQGIRGPLTDNRFSVEIRYEFDTRR
ncbi:TIGR03016 family PEP-CTERM system-associated outer membrane protein [Glaciecola siphonariae]|uniref:TIGR03016 family PEP-CTERM system-associated outer membrane protein n=1 Tax=Glaciecola siphonariae TaxID=521012 RepID=A0ABV9LWD9_9ALTE